MEDRNGNDRNDRTFVENITSLIQGREHFVTLALFVIFLVLAAGTELDLLGAKAQPSDDKFSRFLYLSGAILFFIFSLILINKKKNTNQQRLNTSEQLIQGIQEVSRQTQNISEPEQRSLTELQGVLSELQRSKYIELGLAEWLRKSNNEEEWIKHVTKSTIKEFNLEFEDRDHRQRFHEDIEEYLNSICDSLNSGNRPIYSRTRSIEGKNPYKWALEDLRNSIMETYENSTNILQREKEKGRVFLNQTIDDLLENLLKSP